MDNGGDILRLCRLCLVKDDVNIPIFEEQGDIRQIFLKISSCLPVKVSREDKLPKKICDGCSYKLDMLYEFWNTTANAEKQLLSWLGEAGMNAKMADGTISAVAQQIKPVETFVKQEAIDPSDIHTEDDDDKSYMFQQKFAVEEAGPSATVTSNEEEPPPKRARRTAAVKAQIAMDPESDDDDDSGEPMTKVEDESEESEGDDHEPPFVDVPSTSADDQPGPSGVGKDGVEAPCQTELDSTKEVLAKYSIRESRVELRNIMLDKTIKIINGTAKLPCDGRKKYTCTICKSKFLTSKELDKHRRTHDDDDDEEQEDDDDLIILPEKPRKKPTPAKKQGKFNLKTAPAKNTIKNYFRKAEKTEEKVVRPLLSHKCETCDSIFTCVEDIKLHTSSTCRFKCGVCRKTYNTVYAFTVHVLQHKINLFSTSPTPDKLYKCSLCAESFDDYIDLKTHGILKHNVKSRTISQDEPDNCPEETNGGTEHTEVEITCELCFDIFETKEELNEHMEFHKELGEKPDKKVQEENSADAEESFGKLTEENSSEDDAGEKVIADCTTREVRVELNPIPVIESSYSLAEEAKPDTPPAEPVEEEKRVEENASLKYIVLPANDMIPKKHYKCNKCERIYTSIEDYDSHVPKGCKIENVCPVCLVTISTNSEWYTHITEKHRRWATCKYCFETFNEIKKLDQHKAIKHFNTFKNVCKICFGSFATYAEFDEHLKKEHLNL